MNGSDPVDEMEEKMESSLKSFRKELSKIHVGRANPGMVEDLKVEYYGTQTPLNQIANITAPDPGLLAIQPYDDSQIESIEKAIMEADLGLNPNNDGTVIRIPVPKLSGERREELIDLIKEKAEDTKIAIRNIRRDANQEIDEMEDEGEITEDDKYLLEEDVDDITRKFTDQVDELVEEKSEEIRAL